MPMSSSAANAAPRTFTRFPPRSVRRYCRPLRSMKRMESPSRKNAWFATAGARSSRSVIDSGMRHRRDTPTLDLGDEAAVSAQLARRRHAAALALSEAGRFGGIREERQPATQEVAHEGELAS